MMKYIRYTVTSAWDIIAIPLILVVHLFWGTNLRMEGMSVCTNLREGSWPLNTESDWPFAGWYSLWGGTTFGHAIMYNKHPAKATVVHEHVHEHQFEATMLKSFIVSLIVLLATGKIWLSLVLWSLGYLLYLCSNWITAKLRGASAYKGSVHEEHAYAVGDLWRITHEEAFQTRINRV